MSTYDVFRQVALNAIKYYGNLEVLSYAWQLRRNVAYPSWIPTFGVVDNDSSYEPMQSFLYHAAGKSSPIILQSTDSRALILQGLHIGSIVESGTILRLEEEMETPKEFNVYLSTKARLLMMSRILTQDSWQKDADAKESIERVALNIDAHFADFSAFLLPLLAGRKEDIYISLSSFDCSSCWQQLDQEGQCSKRPSTVYACKTCYFVFCEGCYASGDGCPDQEHSHTKGTVPSFWCPYTPEVLDILHAHAGTGDAKRFAKAAKSACQSRVFLKTSEGWRGIGPKDVEAGDILIVLFGSRVPFVLRRDGSSYRLISDCYVYGLMDGEAMDMWKDGKLDVESFVII